MTTVVTDVKDIKTTIEFKNYLINYFKKKKSNTLYNIFKNESNKQRYAYRVRI